MCTLTLGSNFCTGSNFKKWLTTMDNFMKWGTSFSSLGMVKESITIVYFSLSSDNSHIEKCTSILLSNSTM